LNTHGVGITDNVSFSRTSPLDAESRQQDFIAGSGRY